MQRKESGTTPDKLAAIIGCDIDGTLLPLQNNLRYKLMSSTLYGLSCIISATRKYRQSAIYFGDITGRTSVDRQALYNEERQRAFRSAADIMDFSITSVGAEIALAASPGQPMEPLAGWPPASNWQRQATQECLQSTPELGLQLQEDSAQGPYKISFMVDTSISHAAYVSRTGQVLAEKSLQASVIFSGGEFLDILPVNQHGAPIDKGSAFLHTGRILAGRAGIAPENLMHVVAGDSMNDCAAFTAVASVRGKTIVPNNASDTFKEWVQDTIPASQYYIADGPYALGVYEGLHRQDILK